MNNKIYYSLPDFYGNFGLNVALLNLKNNRPEMFYDNIEIESVYGCFPGAIWNGGRTLQGPLDANNVKNTIKFFNDRNIGCRLTFTNCLLEEKHLNDTWCHLIADVAYENPLNNIIINSETLENYLRAEYPKFEYISSVTKNISTLEEFNAELSQDYKLCVLNCQYNNHWKDLDAIIDPARAEIMVNESCHTGSCSLKGLHYQEMSQKQLMFEPSTFQCCNPIQSYADITKRPQYITHDAIVSEYVPRGFTHFKVVGRGLAKTINIESYVHCFIKPEYHVEAMSLLLLACCK